MRDPRDALLNRERISHAYDFLMDADEYAYNPTPVDWKRNIHHISGIDFSKPFYRTISGRDHTLFVIDIDVYNDDIWTQCNDDKKHRVVGKWEKCQRCGSSNIKIETRTKPRNHDRMVKWACIAARHLLNNELKGHSFLIKFSGSSFHLVQSLNRRVSPHTFAPVFDIIFKNWREREKNYIFRKFLDDSGKTFYAGIDTSFAHEKRVFSGLYSRYAKIENERIYSVPITNQDDLKDHRRVLKQAKWEYLQVKKVKIPPFSFGQYIKNEIEPRPVPTQKDRGTIQPTSITPMNINSVNTIKMTEMDALLRTTDRLCVSEAYRRAREEKGVFWERIPIARFLWWKYEKNLPLIALFFQQYINDAQDNLPENWHKMEKGLNYAIRPSDPKSLDTFKSQVIKDAGLCKLDVCEYACIQSYSDSIISATGFDRVRNLCRKVLNHGRSAEIHKSTRAGVTTSVVLEAIKKGKKILVVVPTNKIAEETFGNIIRLAHEQDGTEFKGAVVGKNMKMCLKLAFRLREMQAQWPGGPTAYEQLPFIMKERCVSDNTECNFYDAVYNSGVPVIDGIPQPVIESDTIHGVCAMATILNYLLEYQVIFMTYEKLGVVFNQFSTQEREATEIIEQLISEFDVLLLDEVSRFVESPTKEVEFYTEQYDTDDESMVFKDTTTVTKNLVDILRDSDERRRLSLYLESRELIAEENLILRVADEFIARYESLLTEMRHTDNKIIQNPMSSELREEIIHNLGRWYGNFVGLASSLNESAQNFLDLMFIAAERRWYVTNVPSGGHLHEVIIRTAPTYNEVVEFTQWFSNTQGEKQVLVTDATMPEISMSELFHIPFIVDEVGDPRGTDAHENIFSDTRTIFGEHRDGNRSYGSRIVSDKVIRGRVFDRIKAIIKEEGTNNILVVCPNKKVHGFLKSRCNDKNGETDLPRNLQVTYFRSPETIGVAHRERTMVILGNPKPPRRSKLWLAQIFHQHGLHRGFTIEALSEKLHLADAQSAFYQTIGRVKDPEAKVRSLVYCIGMKRDDVDELLSIFKWKPQVTHLDTRNFGVMLLAGRVWKDEEISNSEKPTDGATYKLTWLAQRMNASSKSLAEFTRSAMKQTMRSMGKTMKEFTTFLRNRASKFAKVLEKYGEVRLARDQDKKNNWFLRRVE